MKTTDILNLPAGELTWPVRISINLTVQTGSGGKRSVRLR